MTNIKFQITNKFQLSKFQLQKPFRSFGNLNLELIWILMLVFWCLSFSACGGNGERTGEYYGDMIDNFGTLVLAQTSHPHGFGKSDCNICHNVNNIHLTDESDHGFDMAAVRALVANQGLAACPACHGTNGVTP